MVFQISDRYGTTQGRVQPSPGSKGVLQLEWDSEGEYLAILQAGTGVVQLWVKSSNGKVSGLETGEKENTFMAWSKVGPELAIGSAKGNLYIYNRQSRIMVPVKGKHQKPITCGAWNRNNKLAMGSKDKQITISNDQVRPIKRSSCAHQNCR